MRVAERGNLLLHRRGLARQGVRELLALRRARFVPRDGLLCLKPAAGTRVSTVRDTPLLTENMRCAFLWLDAGACTQLRLERERF